MYNNTNDERQKSFIMYMSHKSMFTETSPEQCQELIGRIFDFADTGIRATDICDPLIKICYDQIVFLMERNMKKYAKTCERRSKAAKEAWDKRKNLEQLEAKIEAHKDNAEEQLEYINKYREEEEKIRQLEEDCGYDKLPFD